MFSEALDIVELGLAEGLIELGLGDTEEPIEKFSLAFSPYVEFSES